MNTIQLHTSTPETGLQPILPSKEALLNMFLSERDVRKSSREQYGRTLRQFVRWTETEGYSLADITPARLVAYKEKLLQHKSSLTAASYINSVRQFYQWTEAHMLFPNIAKNLKTPKRKQEFRKESLTPEEAERLLKYAEASCSLRDYALINLMLRTGLRCIEVTRANYEDIQLKQSKRLLYVQGKGKDDRDEFVILSDKAYTPLQAYLDSRQRIQAKEALFTNSRGARLTTRTVYAITKEALKAIGLTDRAYTAHSLRHTAACMILEAGGSLADAQDVLRHASPSTTQIYLHSRKKQHRLKTAAELLIDKLY